MGQRCYSLPGKPIHTVHIDTFISFSETVHQLLDENQRYLSQLTSLLQDATQEMEHSIMVWYAGVKKCVYACKQIPEATMMTLIDLKDLNIINHPIYSIFVCS